eukprot:GHVT01014558.1.p1 GENE.GHVT01014558.1~~GHVT01014558.1.p1  ORF type:complete len:312 (+),score=27.26 GHVT01014558.1:1069-2004(+)
MNFMHFFCFAKELSCYFQQFIDALLRPICWRFVELVKNLEATLFKDTLAFFEENNLRNNHKKRVNKFVPQVLEAVRKGNEKLGVHIMTDLFRPIETELDYLAFPWHWDAWVAHATTAATIKQELLDVLPPELGDDPYDDADMIIEYAVPQTAKFFAGAIHGPDTFKQMRLFQAMRNMQNFQIPFHRPSKVDEKEWNQMEPYMNVPPEKFDAFIAKWKKELHRQCTNSNVVPNAGATQDMSSLARIIARLETYSKHTPYPEDFRTFDLACKWFTSHALRQRSEEFASGSTRAKAPEWISKSSYFQMRLVGRL